MRDVIKLILGLLTNSKSNMGFRLVPISVTVNDLEWRNVSYFSLCSPNSVAFGASYVKVWLT